ncbi:MAG TPA: tetratricopeptide repeat protein [Chloroflexi bacterium]|nr:tetratricopeptide repeat protein [Chloroflexota bacterium]
MTEPTLHYTLHLTGPPQVVAGDTVIHGFESEKALALLAYLALVERPVNRDHLAGLFWGDLDDEHSRGNLRRVLHNLTHRLPGCLEVERHSVRFVPAQATVDVREFRRHNMNGDLDALHAAVTWCGGELLEGVALADCPEFELWLVGERERWRAEVLAALETLITARTRQGDYTAAMALLDRALALAPWLERHHRHKMLLLARRGEFTAALKQYDLCRRLLADELGAPPSHELEALHARIEAARQRPRRAAPLTRPELVGREQELAELSALLLDPARRLITITGPGGVGKSTLAQAAAAENSFAFLDGVLFAPALTIAHPHELPGLLLQQLGLTPNGPASQVEQVKAALRTREVLLVIDNYEHLLPGSAHAGDAEDAVTLLQQLLEDAPHVKVLISSRQRVALRAETVFPLAGLNADAAAALFWQRLAQHSPRHAPTAADAAAARQICAQLEGSPLGIELAAAQSATTDCTVIAAQLQQSLDPLHSELRDLPARQRSLRALFDSSWVLLTPVEQAHLAQLALFGGDFTEAAARAVANADAAHLARLVDKSLLRTAPGGRYTFHPVVRQFAADRLAADGTLAALARTRFVRYYLALLAARNLAVTPARQRTILAEVSAEWLHVQAAWRMVGEDLPKTQLDAEAFTAALDALYHFCVARSLFVDGRVLLSDLAAVLPAQEIRLHGEVGVRLAIFHLRLGEPEQARRLLEVQLATLQTLTPPPTAAIALAALNLATVALHQDRYTEVQYWSAASRRFYQQTGNRWGEAMALNLAGVGEFNQAHYAQAQLWYSQALAIFTALEDARWIAKVQHNLATSYDLTGDHGRALEHFTAALAIHRANGEQWSEALACNSIGFVQINLGLYAAAEATLAEAQRMFVATGAPWGEMMALANRCLLDSLRGDLATAEQHGRRAHELAGKLGDRRYQAYAAHRLGNVLAAQDRWEEATRCYEEALRTRRELGQRALALETIAALAHLALRRGDLAGARVQIETALAALDAPPAGMDEPLHFYLACYQVLAATDDARAYQCLAMAVTLLQDRITRIENEEWRTAYQAIAAHRAIFDLVEGESQQHA